MLHSIPNDARIAPGAAESPRGATVCESESESGTLPLVACRETRDRC